MPRPNAASTGQTLESVPSTGGGEWHAMSADPRHLASARTCVIPEATAAESEAKVTNKTVTNKTVTNKMETNKTVTNKTETNKMETNKTVTNKTETNKTVTDAVTAATKADAGVRRRVALDEGKSEVDTSPDETERVVVDVGKQLEACGCGAPSKDELGVIVVAQLQAVREQYANDGVFRTEDESTGEGTSSPRAEGSVHDEPPRTQDGVVEELRARDAARAKVLLAQARGHERLREEEAETAQRARKHAKRVEHPEPDASGERSEHVGRRPRLPWTRTATRTGR
ncbi:hypothetical protein PHYSODRAFT_305570 [Phytophthora sojae]|uniref:Uncharacterized protein n=1 Tax=Phytophthora sojae (strain P6497) TaxID=1094619 RepID=G5A5N6_PHYSP|nr:hypothetical protein PHYSODRAFT_305570 [Phytophthora sojae]EGZ08641.1 hypothetical protein PHYSODRAFT_305570 [Phytophthora sojae]|eukprot:XP_009535274.1 hypothetical protein PHYSODRAFT_305570 [Phytophthora sojae]